MLAYYIGDCGKNHIVADEHGIISFARYINRDNLSDAYKIDESHETIKAFISILGRTNIKQAIQVKRFTIYDLNRLIELELKKKCKICY